MLNEKDYKAAFSKVKASEATRMEVRNMANRRTKERSGGLRRAAALAAAAAVMTAMAVTAFAAEDIALWFRSYFSRNGEITQRQEEYLAENEQLIGQSKTIGGWTVELQSAIHDDTTGYIILGVTAPEDAVPGETQDANGDGVVDFTFGNLSTDGRHSGGELLTAPEDVPLSGWGWVWAEDGDGLANTRSLVINLHPWLERCEAAPFGSGKEYRISLENVVWEGWDREYEQTLRKEKYQGQTGVAFTAEELGRIYPTELLEEGTWDFTVTFTESAESFRAELLDAPVTTTAWFLRDIGADGEVYYDQEAIALTSVVMQPLTVTFRCDGCKGTPELTNYEDEILNPCVVLKDGTRITLWAYGTSEQDYVTLIPEQPLVLEEADHILMTDGTVIAVPEDMTE